MRLRERVNRRFDNEISCSYKNNMQIRQTDFNKTVENAAIYRLLHTRIPRVEFSLYILKNLDFMKVIRYE